jgi:hypothetical protein
VKKAFTSFSEEFEKLINMFRGSSAEGSKTTSAMTILGAVAKALGASIGFMIGHIGATIGLAVQIVLRTVGNIIRIFRSIVGAIQGVIDIIVGVFTQDWDRAWGGLKKLLGNWINAMVQMLLGLVETVGSVADTIAGLFGADLGAADAVKRLRDEIEKGLVGEDITVPVKVAPVNDPWAPNSAQQKGTTGDPWEKATAPTKPMPMPAVSEMQAGAQLSAAQVAVNMVNSVNRAQGNKTTQIILKLDSKTIAEAIHKEKFQDDARAGLIPALGT